MEPIRNASSRVITASSVASTSTGLQYSLSSSLRNQQADQFLLTTYEELAIDQCKGCPVVTPLEYHGACKRSEASGIRVNEIQLRVAVARQQEIVNQNGPTPHERRLTVGLPLDLAVHAHRHESVGSRIGRELGVEVVLVENRRMRVGTEVRVLEELRDTVAVVSAPANLDHRAACAIAPGDQHSTVTGVNRLRHRDGALPVHVGPTNGPGERVEAVHAAIPSRASSSDRRRDHDEVVFSVDLDDHRAHVPCRARERRRLPPEFTRQLVVRDHARLGRLWCHDQQVAVDKRVLDDGPPWQLAAAELRPDVPVPDRLVGLGVDRVEISQRSRCVDVLTVHGRRGPRSSKTETPRRAVRKCPEFLAAGQLEHAQRVPDLLVPVEQIDLAVA